MKRKLADPAEAPARIVVSARQAVTRFGKTTMRSCRWPWITVILLALAYVSDIVVPFAHHDQYRYFTASEDAHFKQDCGNDTANGINYLIGRPITAELDCLVFRKTQRLEDLSTFRAISL